MENRDSATAVSGAFCQRAANLAEHQSYFAGAMRATLALAVMVATCIPPSTLREAGAEERAKRPAPDAGRTPEDVLLDFIVATAAGDADRIEQLAVPHPDLIVLILGDHASPDVLSAMRERLPKSFSRLKLDDKVKLPNGDSVLIDETHVNKNRVEIMTPDAPMPFIIVREEGTWAVEPAPIIQARLAARESLHETAADGWPEWSPVASRLKGLSPQTERAGTHIRVPRGYTRLSEEGSPAQVWQGPERDDATQANLSVTIITLTPGLAKLTLDDLLTGSLSAVAKRRDRWRLGVVEHGVIAGRRFVRARWTGISKLSNREEYSRRAMRGFAYGTIANGEFVLFMSQDLAVHASSSLPLAEASVLTARIMQPSQAENRKR